MHSNFGRTLPHPSAKLLTVTPSPFRCRRVLWPINMVILLLTNRPTERESYGPSEYSACEIRLCSLLSREMTPFPAAIIADFTLSKEPKKYPTKGYLSVNDTVRTVIPILHWTYFIYSLLIQVERHRAPIKYRN